MASGTYYGFWEYWNLYHKVTFDGINKLILINPGETTLDVQTDIYSAWKEWVRLDDYLKYYPPIGTVGGEPTIGDERLDVTYFLINGWKIKPYSGDYDLVLTGNIFDVDGGSIKVSADINPLFPNNISINTNTSVIVRQIRTEISGSGGSISPETIVSASLFGVQESSLYNIEDRIIAIESILSNPITASLVYSQSLQLTNIENLALSQSLQLNTLSSVNATQSQQLNSLISTTSQQSLQLTSLVNTNASQSALIQALEGKIVEIWELHGLDELKPLSVTQLARTFGAVSQSIVTTGTGSLQRTIITRIT